MKKNPLTKKILYGGFIAFAALSFLAVWSCSQTAGSAPADITHNGGLSDGELDELLNPHPVLPETYDLRFGVISDTHLGASSRVGNTVYPNEQRLDKVLDWYNAQDGVEAIAIVGDITDNGTQTEWDKVSDSLTNHLGALQLIAAMGNHDAFGGGDLNAQANRFEAATGQKTNAHYVIKGYHFIVLNAGAGALSDQGAAGGAIASGRTATPGESASNGDVVPSSVKTWARAQVDAAKAADPGKPVFVLLHWPIRNTFYVSDAWYTSSFGSGDADYFFKNDPEVVVFSGHIHSPNSDPRSIWQGGFTSVNTVSLNYFEMESGYMGNLTDAQIIANSPATKTFPQMEPANIGNAAAQGMIVSVQGSKVTIENFDFGVGQGPSGNVEQIPQTWKFDISKPSLFPYTAARRNVLKQKPVFDSTAAVDASIPGKIRISGTTPGVVTVDFDQATMPVPNPGLEAVHSYRFDFLAGGSVVKSVKQWSDFMWTPSQQGPSYTQMIGGLTSGTTYELLIYAYGSFQERSAQYLTVTFTAP